LKVISHDLIVGCTYLIIDCALSEILAAYLPDKAYTLHRFRYINVYVTMINVMNLSPVVEACI
jgi:hypothetical protein